MCCNTIKCIPTAPGNKGDLKNFTKKKSNHKYPEMCNSSPFSLTERNPVLVKFSTMFLLCRDITDWGLANFGSYVC